MEELKSIWQTLDYADILICVNKEDATTFTLSKNQIEKIMGALKDVCLREDDLK